MRRPFLKIWLVLAELAAGHNAACAFMCQPDEAGSCVYWPSLHLQLDLAELFCGQCQLTADQECFGSDCAEMCRSVHKRCSYHPALSSTSDIEEVFCQSCPFCGQKAAVEYYTRIHIHDDEGIIKAMHRLERGLEESLHLTKAHIGDMENISNSSLQEIAALEAASEEASTRAGRSDLAATQLGAHQALQQSNLQVVVLKGQAKYLHEAHLHSEQLLKDGAGLTEKAVTAIKAEEEEMARLKSLERKANITVHKERRRELSEEELLARAAADKLRDADAEALDKVREEEEKLRKADTLQQVLAQQARLAEQLGLRAGEKAQKEAALAAAASHEVAAVLTEQRVRQQQRVADAAFTHGEERLRDTELLSEHAAAALKQALQKQSKSEKIAAAEGVLAGAAGQALSAVLTKQSLEGMKLRELDRREAQATLLAATQGQLAFLGEQAAGALGLAHLGDVLARQEHEASQASAKRVHTLLHRAEAAEELENRQVETIASLKELSLEAPGRRQRRG